MNPNKKFKSKLTIELTIFSITMLVALCIRAFVFELFFVPTGSMKATILEGDYLFSTKYSYGFSKYSLPFSPDIFKGRIFASEPDRGDVIIFRPPNAMKDRFIKRLIGLPGDKIEIIDGLIYINDTPIRRSYVGEYENENNSRYTRYKEILPNNITYYSYHKLAENNENELDNNYGPYIVPEGHYFFLGDNRHESSDSRFQLGYVPFENFISKARIIIFSTKEMLWKSNISFTKQISRIWTWLTNIRFNRVGKKLSMICDQE